MRLHLIIQRHGLPVARILWTTTPGQLPASNFAASSSAIASTRTPNTAFGNNGCTIAQFLEDVNEVVPLETGAGGISDGESDEFGGQWGLEDYVVEVNGFECLHFMEVEGLLRDGDEVVIRTLEKGDLRARRLSGRIQVSMDGKHLIDGVPFGRPYLKRSLSSRPAIRIPPRKRRRTTFSGWEGNFQQEDEDLDEGPEQYDLRGRELTVYDENSIHSSDQGTVIRHPTSGFNDVHDSDSDADMSGMEGEDISEELKGLREDLESATSLERDVSASPRLTRRSGRASRMAHRDITQTETPSRLSAVSVSRLPSGSVIGPEPSPKSTKSVHFQNLSHDEVSSASEDASESEEDSESDSDSDTSDGSSIEYSSSDSSEASSESESEPEPTPKESHPPPTFVPPGQGSIKTRKSNRRGKLRRKLEKLKSLGYLHKEAKFEDLRAWEAKHGKGPLTELTDLDEPRSQGREQSEFEARRQQLLEQLASGGVDVDGHSEKENIPPRYRNGVSADNTPAVETSPPTASEPPTDLGDRSASATVEETPETVKRRRLDLASSKRLLFGSLGVRTPKSKEDEEATRNRLARPERKIPSSSKEVEPVEGDDEAEDDADEDWQEKLIIHATECVFEDVHISPPPFPFVQRWDSKVQGIIRQRNGKKSKKRKSRDWQEEEQYDGYDEYANGDMELNYDDAPSGDEVNGGWSNAVDAVVNDLPLLPEDLTSVPDLGEGEVKEGAIFAFKQLDMSKATNWQPKISGYRVARVDSVLEDGIIKIQLASRDREIREVRVNDGGARVYDGLEMPGFDDDDNEPEDDGIRQLSFEELVEPKLLQPASSQSAQLAEDGQDASLKNTFVPTGSNASAENFPSVEAELPVVSSQTQVEISQMIHDAGFRSAIDSELHIPALDDPQSAAVEAAQNDEADQRSRVSPVVESPAFGGFSSSPPEVESSRHQVDGAHDGAVDASVFDFIDGSGEKRQDGEENNEDNAEINGHFQDEAVSDRDNDDDLLADSTGSPTSYQVPRSFPSQEAAPNGQSTNSHTTAEYPPLPSLSSQPDNSAPSLIPQPESPTHEPDPNEDGHRQRTQSPSPLNAEPQGPETPARTIVSIGDRSIRSNASSEVPNPFYEKDRANALLNGPAGESQDSGVLDDIQAAVDSQFDLPSLDDLWRSTAPVLPTKSGESPTPKKKRRVLSSPRQLPSSPAFDTLLPDAPPDDRDREESLPQVIVDLTMSSPAQSPSGSDEDFAKSQGLPKGAGWVQKNTPSTRRRTRSSTGAATLDSSPPRPATRTRLRRSG